MRILDQYLNPGMGPFPRKEKSSIGYFNLGETSDEEKLIPHAENETSPDEYNQVSHLSFLTLAEKFGVQSRDEHVKSAEVPSHESAPREETLMETMQPQPGTENKRDVETRSQGSSCSSVSLPEVIFTQTYKTTSEATTSHDDVTTERQNSANVTN
jgi:hypothetical protein